MAQYNLTGKSVLITGASSGIGRELARAFALEGARCLLSAPPVERHALETIGKELRARHKTDVQHVICDLAQEKGPEQLYEQACAIWPDIDVLVNNAGVMAYGNFHEIPPSLHEEVYRVNVIAPIKLMHLFINKMIRRGHGKILNVGSVSAFQPTMHHALYGATKSLLQSLSESIGEEIKKSGVTIHTLNPGYTETPLIHSNNFPQRLYWFNVSGVSDASMVARKGVSALKKNKKLCVPGTRNKIIHLLLIRFIPRKVLNRTVMFFLKSSS